MINKGLHLSIGNPLSLGFFLFASLLSLLLFDPADAILDLKKNTIPGLANPIEASQLVQISTL